MGQQGILRGAYIAFHIELLFERLEEQLDLPAVFVYLGDRCGRPFKLICEQHDAFACFGIFRPDAAELIGYLFFCGEAFELNNLIRRNVLEMIGRFSFYHTVIGVLFQPGNEVNTSLTESCIPGEVGEHSVKDCDITLF